MNKQRKLVRRVCVAGVAGILAAGVIVPNQLMPFTESIAAEANEQTAEDPGAAVNPEVPAEPVQPETPVTPEVPVQPEAPAEPAAVEPGPGEGQPEATAEPAGAEPGAGEGQPETSV